MAIDDLTLARAARAHWGIENRLGWVLDVFFHDDLMRLLTEHGPNLIRNATAKDSMEARREAAGWDQDHLQALINRTAQRPSSDSPAMPAGHSA